MSRFLRVTAMLVVAASPIAQPAASTTTSPSQGGAVIVGRVLDGSTNRPLRDALVSVRGRTPLLTDDSGLFMFENLPAGDPDLRADRSGYFGGLTGQRSPLGLPQGLALAERESALGVVLRLWRFAAIAGVVTDENGLPAPGIEVEAIERQDAGGVASFGGGHWASSQSNDHGMFRLTRLFPGDYVVAIRSTTISAPLSALSALQLKVPFEMVEGIGRVQTPRPPTPTDGSVVAYRTTFFPDVDRPSLARVISLAPGQEFADVQLPLRLSPAAVVAGRVTGPDGPLAHTPLTVEMADATASADVSEVARTWSDAMGNFSVPALTPGDYTLRVAAAAGPTRAAAGRRLLWGQTTLAVGRVDLRDVTLVARRGVRVSGRAEILDGTPAERAAALTHVEVLLAPAAGEGLPAREQSVVPDADGTFAFQDVPPGRYTAIVRSAFPTWSVALDGSDASVRPFVVDDRDRDSLLITASAAPTILNGRVGPENAPDRTATVIAFPVDHSVWIDADARHLELRQVRTHRDGTYQIDGLPAGEYRVIAVFDTGANRLTPASLSGLEAAAVSVRVRAGVTTTLNLQTSVGR